MLVMGVPGRIVRPINENEGQYLRWLSRRYVDLVRRYNTGEFGKPGACPMRLPEDFGGRLATQINFEDDIMLATARRLTSEEHKHLDDLRSRVALEVCRRISSLADTAKQPSTELPNAPATS
jgi:hypothetical protein